MRNISWINLENLENLQQITNYHGENICVFYRLSTLFLIFLHLLFNGVQEASSSNLDTRTKISWQVSTRNLSTFLFSEIEIRKIKWNSPVDCFSMRARPHRHHNYSFPPEKNNATESRHSDHKNDRNRLVSVIFLFYYV